MSPTLNPPRGRPAEFDRTEVLGGLLAVFWARGFEGTSVAELEAATGLSRSSLYASFGDKQALFEQAADHYVHHTAAFVGEALAEPSLRDAVHNFLFGAATFLTDASHPPGCFVIVGALVCGPQSEAAKAVLATRRQALENMLVRRLQAGQDHGALRADADVPSLAKYLATLHQGMAVQAATGASRAALLETARMGLELVEARLVKGGG